MLLIKKNLKTVKNKLLCELEDYLIDGILPQLAGGVTKEDEEKFAKDLMQTLINAIKENAIMFTLICYTNEDGSDLVESDLVDIPLKMKIFTECLPDIMEIMSDYLQDGDEVPGKPKVKRIRKR